MCECGCDIQILRCRDHGDDVVLVLEPSQASVVEDALAAYQACPPSQAGDLGRVQRMIARRGVPHHYDL